MTDDNAYDPFAYKGNIVSGEDFVGRQDLIRTIQRRVINPPNPGCLAIVGSPKIGKSSLIYHSLIDPPSISLLNKKIISIWISLGKLSSHEKVFFGLVEETLNVLSYAKLENDNLFKKGQEILEKSFTWIDIQHKVNNFFRQVKRAGWRVIAVIDEFDRARHIFQDGVGFLALRHLAYEPQHRITIVTISRRPLSEITKQCRQDVSTFPPIFQDEYVRCFSKDELSQLLDKLNRVALRVNQNIFDFVWDNTGGHPHLASVLASKLADSYVQNCQYDLEKALTNSASEFLKYYDRLVRLLKEDGSFDKTLLKILFGPATKETILNAERLERYGLINKNQDGYHTVFSEHFEDYLRHLSRSRNLWPIWDETEGTLRTFIDKIIQDKFQVIDWIPLVEKAHKELKDEVFDKCRELQRREQMRFGSRALTNLLDFTNLDDLVKIISKNWDLFAPTLGETKKNWDLRSQSISTVCNSMTYNRSNKVLGPYELEKAEDDCREILDLLQQSSADIVEKHDANSASSVTIYADNFTYHGDMMSDKPTIDARGSKFGGGLAAGNQTGGTLNDHSTTHEPKQTLAEAAQEIQQLLKQLEENNPDATETERKAFVTAMIPPKRRDRFFNALKAGGQAAIEEFLDNPYVNVAIATIEGWQENS